MKKLLGILLFISIALSANAQLLWKVSGKGLEVTEETDSL